MSEPGDNRLPTLASEIRKAHASAGDFQRRSLEQAMKAGEMLLEAKALVGHGRWLPWLREHCQLAERTAQLYMKLAKNRRVVEYKSATVADLAIRGAIEAVADPFNDREWCERFFADADAWRAARPEIPDLPADWSPEDYGAMLDHIDAYNAMCRRHGWSEGMVHRRSGRA
jgi:hypothetical protein